MDFSKLNIDRLLSDCNNIDCSNQIYIDTYYKEFSEFIKAKDTVTYFDIVVAGHMVYGRMPTVLRVETG